MPMLSSTAWVLHDLGLATAIGGAVFGKTALQPALENVADPHERDRVSDAAWRRFGLVNLAAHGAVAASWFIGRSMLSDTEAGRQASPLTRAKDALVVTSAVTGLAGFLLGRKLGRRVAERRGPEQVREDHGNGRSNKEVARTRAIERAVGAVGTLNLAANIGVAAVTSIQATEAAEIVRRAIATRKLR